MTRAHRLRVALVAGALLSGACSPASDTRAAGATLAPAITATRTAAGAADGQAIPAPTVDAEGLAAVKNFRSVRGIEEPALPASVTIPAIGVDSPLLTLGRETDGTIEVPDDFQRAGWFREGAIPGERGPAVILGHVDSRAGPAAFYHLHELEAGEDVLIERADGSTARFVVDRVDRYDKDAFPTQEVYYPTLEATLRLVTCGGEFDAEARSYRDNIVVFATLAA